MWIEPTTFSPRVGEIVGVKFRVGQDMLGDPLPRDSSLIKQFVVEDGQGRKPVIGRDGNDPAGFLRVAELGLLVIGYRSNPSAVELGPEKFNQYLKDEGLDEIAALRARRNQTGSPATKLLPAAQKVWCLRVHPQTSKATGGWVLRSSFWRKKIHTPPDGEELPVRLTYENRPLAGALVVAMNRINPLEKVALRTDNDGRVRFRLARAGCG